MACFDKVDKKLDEFDKKLDRIEEQRHAYRKSPNQPRHTWQQDHTSCHEQPPGWPPPPTRCSFPTSWSPRPLHQHAYRQAPDPPRNAHAGFDSGQHEYQPSRLIYSSLDSHAKRRNSHAEYHRGQHEYKPSRSIPPPPPPPAAAPVVPPPLPPAAAPVVPPPLPPAAAPVVPPPLPPAAAPVVPPPPAQCSPSSSPMSHCRSAASLPTAAVVPYLKCNPDISGEEGEWLNDEPPPPAVISQLGSHDTGPTLVTHVVHDVVPSSMKMEISEGVTRVCASSSFGKGITELEIKDDVETLVEDYIVRYEDIPILTKSLASTNMGATNVNLKCWRSHIMYTCIIESWCGSSIHSLIHYQQRPCTFDPGGKLLLSTIFTASLFPP